MAKKKTARQYVFEGMELLPGALIPFVEGRLESRHGEDWQSKFVQKWQQSQVARRLPDLQFDTNKKIDWDQLVLLRGIQLFWRDDFRAVLRGRDISWAVIQDLIDVRNDLAHYGDFTYSTADRALKKMHRLAEAVGADEAAAQIGAMRNSIQRLVGKTFNGFGFGDDVFNYHEGKKVLNLARNKLRKNADLPGIDPDYLGRRIYDDSGPVWNVLVFKEAPDWRKNPHLTLSIGHEYVSAMVTLPDKASEALNHLKKLDEKGFHHMVESVLAEMRSVLRDCDGMEPRLRVRQRPVRSVRPQMAAYVDVDLRTLDGDSKSGVKRQPEWVGAVFHALKNERSSPEVQIGARFPYRTCPEIANSNADNFVAKTWIACKPYIDVLFERKDAPATP